GHLRPPDVFKISLCIIYHSDYLDAKQSKWRVGNLIQHATKKLNWFHCNYSVRSFLDAFSPLRDMGIFACRKQYAWGAVDQAAFRLFVRKLRVRFAARLSLYKCRSACIL